MGLVAIAFGPLAWCLAFGAAFGGDPMVAIELAGGAVAVVWAGLVVREVAASHRLGVAVSHAGWDADLFGVPCRITPAIGGDALVVGAVRPRILVGADLVARLSWDELQAVVYHEDHHRRTRAPLRAAALAAWLRLLGRSPSVRDHVLDRLADLESLADADAIRRGSSPGSLARALLKGQPSTQPVAFSYASDRRVEWLLARADGTHVNARGRLPYEWLPVAVLAVVTLSCHVAL
jgi:hypothetical protein